MPSPLTLREGGRDGHRSFRRRVQARCGGPDHRAGLPGCGGGAATVGEPALSLRMEDVRGVSRAQSDQNILDICVPAGMGGNMEGLNCRLSRFAWRSGSCWRSRRSQALSPRNGQNFAFAAILRGGCEDYIPGLDTRRGHLCGQPDLAALRLQRLSCDPSDSRRARRASLHARKARECGLAHLRRKGDRVDAHINFRLS